MKEVDIITKWLSVPKNADQLIPVGYKECEYNFIVNNLEMIHIRGTGDFFKVGDSWQRIIKIKN